MLEFILPVRPFTQWAVYAVHVPTHADCVYIGVCKLVQLLECPDARNNSEFQKLMLEQPITIRTSHIVETQSEARRHASDAIRLVRPVCNLYGRQRAARTAVRCIDDGRTFATLTECAEYYHVPAPSLSNHLNNRMGYRTVRGMKFERIG